MNQKSCIRCSELKPLAEFYAHAAMADGHLGKCKACCRADAIQNRRNRIDYYREYDRQRLASAARKLWLAERQRRYRAGQPSKTAARSAVRRAVSRGVLIRMPCEVCGCREVDAHHDDYSKPLAVRWLCRVHHLIAHGRYITVGE